MTTEKLHDAIGLLPSDLIAETDKLRCAKPNVLHWKRYATMAACFAVVLSCSLFAMRLFAPKRATETAMEAPVAAVPMEQAATLAPAADTAVSEESAVETPAVNGASGNSEAVKDSAAQDTSSIFCRRVETPLKPSAACFSSSAVVTLIHSQTELEAYQSEKGWIYDFTDFPAVCKSYDENWFAEHDLLLLTIHAAYPDVPYTITSIENTGGTDPKGWDWYVFYTTSTEGHPEGKTTCFHLLTELEKGQIPPEDSILTIADPIY